MVIYLEPESEFLSGIKIDLYKVEKDTHVFRVGRIVKLGPGRWAEEDGKPLNKRIPITEVKVGDRVLFVKFIATHTETAKRVQNILGSDFAIVDRKDLLMTVDEDFDIRSIDQ